MAIAQTVSGLDKDQLLAAMLALKKGDFSHYLPDHFVGIDGKIADAFNSIVDFNQRMVSEFGRVANTVGKRGVIEDRVILNDASGSWSAGIHSINTLIGDVVQPTAEMARVVGAVAKGDLTQSIKVDLDEKELRGEFLRTAKLVNTMVDQLSSFASEVTRVAREVGTDGKLGGQAEVRGVSGTWKELTDSVNSMASNLTNQVRNIADVTIAVANGDLSKKITVDVRGEFLQLKDAINTMVEQLRSFSSEVTRVAREVGTDGRLGGQAVVPGVAGVWKDLTDNVNIMAANLTGQVRNIAQVTTAVAKGDLSTKITVDAKGEILELKNTVNIMVDQLSSFASEVTRVAREVGTDGKLGGQAEVKGVSGTWKDLTDNVNIMAANLTGQVRNIAQVTTAVAKGDLAQKITADAKGEILELKNTINTMVDQLSSFASEVTRVAREVGTDGKLGGQAVVPGVAGVWKDLTDNVNGMAANLTGQVRNIAQVTTAVAKGDLSTKITVDAKGEILELKNTVNIMVDQLSSFASEVTRVAREVGTDGKLGGQAEVPGVSGTWKDLTDSVNGMAANLTGQVRNIAQVTTAVAKGDLSTKITVDAKGEILELKDTVNIMVDQLSSFASEVTRVAREVGTDGKLGGQAEVQGVSGTWKDLTDSVNGMAANLTGQVRNIAQVTTAVAKGDLSTKITVDAKGEILELKDTVNTMVDQLSSFASEVTRVAREVGTDGKLGGQAEVQGVSGTWKDLTDSVNGMAANLTGQVRNIAQVTTAVAKGDLSTKITVDAKGEILELKETVNIMVDQLSSFASEVTRVAREVGTDGKLGGQAEVKGVSGTWKELTDSVNSMASNLTGQVRNIAQVTTAVAKGDLSTKITVNAKGEILELKDTVNTMVDQLSSFASEVTRVAREVGTDGKLGGQAEVPGVSGTWKDLTDSVNTMAANLTGQVRNIAQVTTAVAKGDLSTKITVDAKGEILELKNTINTMVDQLSSFASEVTRVAREVGTDGKLGGQAEVKGVSGTWKELTDSVNSMASNLTNQVRNIAKVVTAIANGDLKKKLTVEAKGEIAELADTINEMIDTLATFADQVTTVARMVGVEGNLGGQANVPGASGIWKDLTDNVNQLAANLTTQVRAIAEVATAVTKGDLTQTVQVGARGEVNELKNNINEMIRNLKDTTEKNSEQDWLKTNLARFARLLSGQKDRLNVAKMILSELAPLVNMQHGVFYVAEELESNDNNGSTFNERLNLLASYAYRERENVSTSFAIGEGIVGQCAAEKRKIVLNHVPPDYIHISSGLGEATPANLIALPIPFEGHVKGVIELASFEQFTETHQTFLDQLAESIGIVLNMIEASMRTEDLLAKSQSLTLELQQTNDELEDKAKLLAEQKAEVDRKNLEIETAKKSLEDKAEQLALTSKYKSEFLSNMSHELRTPLNSLLILAQQLFDNPSGNLTQKEVEYAKTIHSAGNDLLMLINDILDLSKIESGTVSLDIVETSFDDISESMDRMFRHLAEEKGLKFDIELHQDLPVCIITDQMRLQQVLKNLLSNAFKFTARGNVRVKVGVAAAGWSKENRVLNNADSVIAFAVADTGIGVQPEKQKIIFEAFQQADGTTSRKYGGTGLGLAISREIAFMLGGELRLVNSEPGSGSTFVLYLPQRFFPAKTEFREVRELDVFDGISRHMLTSKGSMVDTRPVQAVAPIVEHHHVEIEDDRLNIHEGDLVILIIEDDFQFATVLLDVVRQNGFKGIVALTGTVGISHIHEYMPHAITLDVLLPDMDGWMVLDHIKADPSSRHIPVTIISGDDVRVSSRRRGAYAFLQKPVNKSALEQVLTRLNDFTRRRKRSLLVVEDNALSGEAIVKMIQGDDLEISLASTAEEALTQLRRRQFDCMLLDLKLPGMSGLSLLQTIQTNAVLKEMPVVVYTGKDLTKEEESQLMAYAQGVIIKGVSSPERVLDETSLFLHRAVKDMPEIQRSKLEEFYKSDLVLRDRKILLVDDDIRNLFALTSVLERYDMKVITAEDGKAALQLLKEHSDIDVVLMDIMMPEMDGYETMRSIRNQTRLANLPIVALTAKAMKGDREKCIEAGASDYITKPVNTSQLTSRLRTLFLRKEKSPGNN